MSMARIEWQDEFMEIDTDNPDIGELESAMRFKAEYIKAKADLELFVCVADALRDMSDSILKGAYLKRGHWVESDDDDCCIRCSVCNGYFALPEPVHECHPIDDMGLNYCPNCGADMRETSICQYYTSDSRCKGTREFDVVNCGGDKSKCIYK